MNNILKIFKRNKKNNKDILIEKIRSSNKTCVIKNNVSLDNVKLYTYVTLLDNATLKNVCIDDYSYVGQKNILNNVSIGKFCSLGPNILIGLATHPVKGYVSTYPAFYSPLNEGCSISLRNDKIFNDVTKNTVIGHDVWIGANVIIPGGIRISTGSIIAAGSVVVKDVKPYSIVGGNPAKLIRYRFPQDSIDILIKSEWWEWPISKIRNIVNKFSNIDEFINYLDSIHS